MDTWTPFSLPADNEEIGHQSEFPPLVPEFSLEINSLLRVLLSVLLYTLWGKILPNLVDCWHSKEEEKEEENDLRCQGQWHWGLWTSRWLQCRQATSLWPRVAQIVVQTHYEQLWPQHWWSFRCSGRLCRWPGSSAERSDTDRVNIYFFNW